MIIKWGHNPLAVALAVAACTLAFVALGAAMPANALAVTDFGQKLGEELKSWGTWLLPAVVALVGIPALVKRDLGQAMVILLIALIIGGFVWGDGAVSDIINKIWQGLR